jgi:hypothetical protein
MILSCAKNFTKNAVFSCTLKLAIQMYWYCKHTLKERERFGGITSHPNEIEYLILWAWLIWISHMKAIKLRLPFDGMAGMQI